MSTCTFCFAADNTSKKGLIFLLGLAFYLKVYYLSEFVIQLLCLHSGPQINPRNLNIFSDVYGNFSVMYLAQLRRYFFNPSL